MTAANGFKPLQSDRRLRIVFFVTRDWYHPGTTGGDNNLWEYARYLASVGHKVRYVTSSYKGAAQRERLDGIDVVRIGDIHLLWLRTFLYYWTYCRGKVDVVVTEGFGGSRIPRLAPLYVREPIVTAWHQVHKDLFEAQYPRAIRWALNLLERFAAWIHRDTVVQAYTDEGKKDFVGLGFRPERVFVLPVSIREEWLENQPATAAREPAILWLGKLRRYKCPDHAVQAMAHVVKQVPTARLILAIRRDDIIYERKLRALVEELNLSHAIDFRINVSEAEKRDLLHRVRALVVPSAVEGFGIVVLEANACGVPVVASSGVPSGAVREGYNGVRYAFGDVAAMSGIVTRLLTDDELHGRLSNNARRFATHFAWRSISAQYEDIVQDVAASAHGLVSAGRRSDVT